MTAICVTRNESELVVGIDSMVTEDDSSGQTRNFTECKIKFANNFYFTAMGFLGDPKKEFYLPRFVGDLCAQHSSLNAVAEAFKKKIRGPLGRALTKSRNDNRSSFSALTGKRLAVLIFSGHTGIPECVIIGFKFVVAKTRVSANIELELKIGVGSDKQFLWGPNDQMQEKFKTEAMQKLATDSPNEYVRRFLACSAQSSPNSVGAPFSIISIKSDGETTWTERGPCGELP